MYKKAHEEMEEDFSPSLPSVPSWRILLLPIYKFSPLFFFRIPKHVKKPLFYFGATGFCVEIE